MSYCNNPIFAGDSQDSMTMTVFFLKIPGIRFLLIQELKITLRVFFLTSKKMLFFVNFFARIVTGNRIFECVNMS